MIERASDVVAKSFRAFAIRNFIIALLVVADLILLLARTDVTPMFRRHDDETEHDRTTGTTLSPTSVTCGLARNTQA
jgi:hypothetical protein